MATVASEEVALPSHLEHRSEARKVPSWDCRSAGRASREELVAVAGSARRFSEAGGREVSSAPRRDMNSLWRFRMRKRESFYLIL